MTRSEAIFGEDVEVFRPERFLECDEKTKDERASTIDIIFGNGRWMCAGKPIVMMELHKVFFEVRERELSYTCCVLFLPLCDVLGTYLLSMR